MVLNAVVSLDFSRLIYTACLIILFFGLYPSSIVAAGETKTNPVLVSAQDIDQIVDLNPNLEILIDPDRLLKLPDIQKPALETNWHSNPDNVLTGHNKQNRYWFRVRIKYNADNATEAVLYTNQHPSLLGNITFFILDEEGQIIKEIASGAENQVSKRDMAKIRYSVKVTLKPNKTTTLYGWIDNSKTGQPAVLPLYLTSENKFHEQYQFMVYFLIVFYAVMAALLIYNCFLFFALRQAVYGLYILFLFAALLAGATIDGVATYWLWPESPRLAILVPSLNGVFIGMVYLAFIIYALDCFRYIPFICSYYRKYIILGWICFIYVLLLPTEYYASFIAQAYSAIAITMNLCIITYAVIKKIPTANYLLTAEIIAIVGTTCFILMVQQALPINTITFWGAHWGFLGESIVLSLALAARTRELQQESITHLHNYRNLYEQSIEGLFEYDIKSQAINGNTAFASLFGFKNMQEYSSNAPPTRFFDDSDNETISVTFQRDSLVNNYHAQIIQPNSKDQKWVSFSARMIFNDKNEPIRIEGSMRDITETKQKEIAEREVIKVQEEQKASEHANQEKNKFFASISHEFRTPLTAILGYVETALGQSVSKTRKDKNLVTIRHSGEHMLRLVNDILDLSKIEAQKLIIEKIDLNLITLINDIKETISILAKEKGIVFNVNICFPIPNVICSDPTRLKQILINLCNNAVKFTQRGSVTLKLAYLSESNNVSFCIEDTGIGLKEDQIKNIFSAFTQADSTTTRNFGGTGLGLHLSQQLSAKLGGGIGVESQFGQGSKFTLTLPSGLSMAPHLIESLPTDMQLIKEDYAQTQPASKKASKISEQYKVLIADDNEVNQKLVAFHVKQAGAEPILAIDGADAIAEAMKNDIDLILMDMEMPIVNGLDAVEIIRAKGFGNPIYALTGNEGKESIEACLKSGCNGHLSKPIDKNMLTQIILSNRGGQNKNQTAV